MGKSGSAALLFTAFSVLGVIVALILQTMYENEIVVHLAITSSDLLASIQIVIILICVLMGIIIAVLKN